MSSKSAYDYWNAKLDPCPFCGGKAHLELRSRGYLNGKPTRVTYAFCRNCNARSAKRDVYECGDPKDTRSQVVNDWNNRQTSVKEQVNHPSHYNKEGRKECIVEMEELFGTFITAIFCLTSAFKYLYRAGEKDGNSERQDLNKVKWYIEWVEKKNAVKRIPALVFPSVKLYKHVKAEYLEREKEYE